MELLVVDVGEMAGRRTDRKTDFIDLTARPV
jgi:hypothetical protein